MNGPKEQTRAELALERIKKIIIDEDLAALCIVQDQESAAYINRLDTTWSCIRMEKDEEGGVMVRIRSKRTDYPDKATQKKHIEKSCGIIMTFLNYSQNIMSNLGQLMEMVAANYESISHVEENPRQHL